jgi:pyruvate-formate lyase
MAQAQQREVKGAAPVQVLSTQEQAIAEGRKTLHGGMSERIMRMHEAVRSKRDPIVGLSRALLLTESLKETEGQPFVLRWAKALKHIADNLEVAILPDELIVGRAHNSSADASSCSLK